MTASPEELRLMLYEGALKFCRQARVELEREKRDFEAIYDQFMRAQRIVLELSSSLNHQANPDLCERLGALYTWIYRLLVDANMERETAKVDEAIKLLDYERETWQLLMQKNADLAGESQPASPTRPLVGNPYGQSAPAPGPGPGTYARSA